jgi:hypothetical protein
MRRRHWLRPFPERSFSVTLLTILPLWSPGVSADAIASSVSKVCVSPCLIPGFGGAVLAEYELEAVMNPTKTVTELRASTAAGRISEGGRSSCCDAVRGGPFD